jgi:hypothetical protein
MGIFKQKARTCLRQRSPSDRQAHNESEISAQYKPVPAMRHDLSHPHTEN